MSIAEFVVGLGIDSQPFDRGLKLAETKLGQFKSAILQTGNALGSSFKRKAEEVKSANRHVVALNSSILKTAAILATFSAAKAFTVDFTRQVNEARQFSQYVGVSVDSLTSMQRVAATFGASLGELNGLFAGIAQAKAGLNVGEIGVFQQLAQNGVNIDAIIGSKDANEAVLRLADQVAKLGTGSRLNVANALGLTPQTLDMLLKGSERLRELQEKMRDIRPTTERMTQVSREWTAGTALLSANVGRLSDRLGTELAGCLNLVIDRVNTWFNANQKTLDSLADGTIKTVTDNVDKLAMAFGVLTGEAILNGLSALVARVGGIAAAVGTIAPTVARLAGVFGLLMLWDEDPEKIFGEKWGKALKLTPGEFFDWLWTNQDKTPFSPENLARLMAESDETGGLDLSPAVIPAAPAGDQLTGGAPEATSAKSNSGKAVIRMTTPLTVNAVTKVPGETITKTVEKVLTREFDAVMAR